MKPLTFEQTTDNGEKETKERISKLGNEETTVSKKLNEIRLRFETEKKKFDDELAELESNHALRRKGLIQEIAKLHEDREEALRPLQAELAEEDARLSAKRKEELDKREEILIAEEKRLEKVDQELGAREGRAKLREDQTDILITQAKSLSETTAKEAQESKEKIAKEEGELEIRKNKVSENEVFIEARWAFVQRFVKDIEDAITGSDRIAVREYADELIKKLHAK